MITNYAIYNPATGEIEKTISIPEEDLKIQPEIQSRVFSALDITDMSVADDTHFIEGGEVKAKQIWSAGPFHCAPDQTVTIRLPESAKVSINDDFFDMGSGDTTLELEFETPGIYHVELQMIRYICPEGVMIHVKED